MDKIKFQGLAVLPAILIDQIINKDKHRAKVELQKYLESMSTAGYSPSQLPMEQQEELARLLKDKYRFDLPRYGKDRVSIVPHTLSAGKEPNLTDLFSGQITEQNIDPREVVTLDPMKLSGRLPPERQPVGGFAVNMPAGGLKPLPKTLEDFQRELMGAQAGMYKPSHEAQIAGTYSEIAKRGYDMDQSKRTAKFGQSVGQLISGRGLEGVTTDELNEVVAGDNELDPLSKERVLKNYGLEPTAVRKEEKWNWATRHIQEAVSQGVDLNNDMGFWSNYVFPYVDADQALGLIKHYTPSAGTIGKETLSDFELGLIKKYQAGELKSPQDLMLLANIVMRNSPFLSALGQIYLIPSLTNLMSPDPTVKKKALEEFNQSMKGIMENWFMGPVSQPAPPPDTIDNKVQKKYKFNPKTGSIEEVK